MLLAGFIRARVPELNPTCRIAFEQVGLPSEIVGISGLAFSPSLEEEQIGSTKKSIQAYNTMY